MGFYLHPAPVVAEIKISSRGVGGGLSVSTLSTGLLEQTVLAEQVSGRAETQDSSVEMLQFFLNLLHGRGLTFSLKAHMIQNLVCEVM